MHRLAFAVLLLVLGCGGGAGRPGDGASLDAEASDGVASDVGLISCDKGRIRCGELCCAVGEVCEGSQCKAIADCTVTPCTGLSYCDLSTKKCLPGCAMTSQCSANQTCNLVNHQCECVSGYHSCSGVCLSNTSPASCGTSCSPCPDNPNGSPTCSAGQCGIACKTGYHLCGKQCASNTSIASCGSSCGPCPGVTNGQPTCDGNTCGFTCNPGFNACGGKCVANSVTSCGPSCTVCPSKPGTKPSCVANKCKNECLKGVSLGPMATLIQAPIGRVLAADVTGDGHADVIATNTYAYALLVYAGTGNGSFKAVKSYTLPFKPESMVVGDFNGDKKLDVVIGAYILLSGAATLKKTALYDVSKLAAGDFNKDGKLDLASSKYVPRVWIGDGAGGFKYKANASLQSKHYALGAADFNSDGRDDLVVTGLTGVQVALSLADGTPGTPITSALPSYGLGLGDLNGDGKPDVVTSTTTSLALLIGTGSGAFQTPVTYAENFSNTASFSIGIGDLNGDGKQDVVYPGNLGSTKSVRFRLGTGTGALSAPTSTVVGTGVPMYPMVNQFSTADFNGDGLDDVAVGWGGVRVLLAKCK